MYEYILGACADTHSDRSILSESAITAQINFIQCIDDYSKLLRS